MTHFAVAIPAGRILRLDFDEKLSLAEFEAFCAQHPELLVEREPDGQLTVMSPIHLLSGGQEADVSADLVIYARTKKNGKAFSATTGFTLPDGSVRSADAAFVNNERLAKLTTAQKHSFAPVVPNFVIEVRSDTDRIGKLQTKMKDTWIANGVQLAWLLDPKNQLTYIYRADGSERVISGFDKVLEGEEVLPGFQFDLSILEV